MSRLDEVISVSQNDAFMYGCDYTRDIMLEEIAISLAVIADTLTEMWSQHESEVTE